MKNSAMRIITKRWSRSFALERARWYQHRPAEELYDVVNDPYQLNNLADDEQYDEAKAPLAQALANFMQQQGDLGEATERQAQKRQVDYLKMHLSENKKVSK